MSADARTRAQGRADRDPRLNARSSRRMVTHSEPESSGTSLPGAAPRVQRPVPRPAGAQVHSEAAPPLRVLFDGVVKGVPVKYFREVRRR